MDIVGLQPDMRVGWVVEIKWSDIYRDKPEKLKGQIGFCKKHGLKAMKVTSKTVFSEEKLDEVLVQFWPAALYCYILGHNILKTKWRN